MYLSPSNNFTGMPQLINQGYGFAGPYGVGGVGYQDGTGGYQYWDPNTNIDVNFTNWNTLWSPAYNDSMFTQRRADGLAYPSLRDSYVFPYNIGGTWNPQQQYQQYPMYPQQQYGMYPQQQYGMYQQQQYSQYPQQNNNNANPWGANGAFAQMLGFAQNIAPQPMYQQPVYQTQTSNTADPFGFNAVFSKMMGTMQSFFQM
ncbi:MAG TPA: hypothetical protein P5556_09510 [Candidatus Gastranaerophilales bacterium]|nr:hypothetical protein [Candidatus Gastranaerophilales bacterium]